MTTAYSAYEYNSQSHQLAILGLNGERCDLLSSLHMLGQGFRSYSPMLMRFNASDSLSPFDDGGVSICTVIVLETLSTIQTQRAILEVWRDAQEAS